MEYKIIQKNVRENTFYIKVKILGFIWIYLRETLYFGVEKYILEFISIQYKKLKNI